MRKSLIVVLSIVVLAIVGGFIASRHKYEVKKFVKKHDLLYSLARKTVALKARIFAPDEAVANY